MATAELMPKQVAVGELRPEHAIMKLENDNIQSLALAQPRSLAKIKSELMEQLDEFPVLAEEAIYNKPVGKDKDTGQQKYARNLSIRSAEILAEAYGYNRVRCDIVPAYNPDGSIDETRVKIEATFTDYQRGRIWQDSGIVSKFYKSRDGRMVKHDEDRFNNVVCKAEASKRIREAILRCVNAGLKEWYFSECEKRQDDLLTEAMQDKIVGQFSTMGVTLEQIESILGRKKEFGWTKIDRKNLLGIWQAIKDGETTVGEAFGSTKPESKPTGPVTAEDLTSAATTSSDKEEGHSGPGPYDVEKPDNKSGKKKGGSSKDERDGTLL